MPDPKELNPAGNCVTGYTPDQMQAAFDAGREAMRKEAEAFVEQRDAWYSTTIVNHFRSIK